MLQVLVTILGGFSLILSFAMVIKFWPSRKRIARAVSIDKCVEAFLVLMTLVFSFTAHGVWDLGLSQTTIAWMRIAMFSASIVASSHLWYACWKIEHEEN